MKYIIKTARSIIELSELTLDESIQYIESNLDQYEDMEDYLEELLDLHHVDDIYEELEGIYEQEDFVEDIDEEISFETTEL